MADGKPDLSFVWNNYGTSKSDKGAKQAKSVLMEKIRNDFKTHAIPLFICMCEINLFQNTAGLILNRN